MARIAVIGGGAAGVTSCVELALRGHDVVLFERGKRLPEAALRATFNSDLRRSLITQSRPALGDSVVVDTSLGRTTTPEIGWTSCQLGGGSAVWGGWADRPARDDFMLRSRMGRHLERSPAYHLVDWPVGYDELYPYIIEAETLLGVQRDLLASASFPIISMLSVMGWQFVPVALAESARCLWGLCQPKKLRQLWPWRHVSKAEHLGVDIRTDSRVIALEVDPDKGKALALHQLKATGSTTREAFEVFVLACGAIQTVRLLLLSDYDRISPLSARNLGSAVMFHMFGPQFELYTREKLPPQPPVADWSYREINVDDRTSQRTPGGFVSIHTRPAKHSLTGHAGNGDCVVMRFTGEDLPCPINRIVLDRRIRDRHGIPIACVRRPWSGDRSAVHRHMSRTLRQAARGLGPVHYGQTTFEDDWARLGDHQLGGCRMGEERRDSLVLPTGRLHDVHNVYVVDASVFPTALPVTPTLTTVANCIRMMRQL
jgi:choline dehydrogenase-like flavoprotein